MYLLNSLRLKLLLTVFLVLLFWQSYKLWTLYSVGEVKNLIEKQSSQQILITVYYEALCPDSRSFILKQLVPTFNSIEDYIELQLIPYGKAETMVVDNDFKFECQHGQIECEANIIHACSINKISDSRELLELIACMIKNNLHPMAVLNTCGSSLSAYKNIVDCAQSTEGRRLLSKFGQVTKELPSGISFVPTITLDNDIDNQILILKNLLHQVCLRISSPPRECRGR